MLGIYLVAEDCHDGEFASSYVFCTYPYGVTSKYGGLITKKNQQQLVGKSARQDRDLSITTAREGAGTTRSCRKVPAFTGAPEPGEAQGSKGAIVRSPRLGVPTQPITVSITVLISALIKIKRARAAK